MSDNTKDIKLTVTARISGCRDDFGEKKAIEAYLARLRNICLLFRSGEKAETIEVEITGGDGDGTGKDSG